MAVESVTTNVKTRAGRPDYETLAKPTKFHPKGRLSAPLRDDGTVFDPNPSPKQMIQGTPVSRGYALSANPPWRANYGPQEHYEMLLMAKENQDAYKDTTFVTELYKEEGKAFAEWLQDHHLRNPMEKVTVEVSVAAPPPVEKKKGGRPKGSGKRLGPTLNRVQTSVEEPVPTI
jgi:hypothetical protein